MRKLLILSSVLLFFPLMLAAQSGIPQAAFGDETPRTTIFGGYSYLRNNSNGFNGWTGQGTFNFTPHLGVTADFSGNYRSPGSFSLLGITAGANQHLYTYLFGPTVSTSFGKTSVFAHALFGQSHSSLSAGITAPIIGGISTGVSSANAFAMEFGGGLDVGVSRHLAIRVAQLDYLRTQFNATDALATGFSSSLGNSSQNTFRYSGGLVFRF
jgi:hypothetical protein